MCRVGHPPDRDLGHPPFLFFFLLFFSFLFGGLLFALLFLPEAVFQFLEFVFVEFKFLAEVAAAAFDAVGGRFADGLLGRENVALRVFVGFADGFGGARFGFLGEAGSELESVEVDACLATVDAVGGE